MKFHLAWDRWFYLECDIHTGKYCIVENYNVPTLINPIFCLSLGFFIFKSQSQLDILPMRDLLMISTLMCVYIAAELFAGRKGPQKVHCTLQGSH